MRLLIAALVIVSCSALADSTNRDDIASLVSPGYSPTENDERGFWLEVEKLERRLASSNRLVTDTHVLNYIQGVINRVLGDYAQDVRFFVIRDPSFNASMFPTGLMIIHTGLLTRMQNEAQLAAVIGHEAGHYLRKHSIARWRSLKKKTGLMAIVGVTAAAASGYQQQNWFDLANAINSALVLSVFQYNRTQETEADVMGLNLLANAGYDPKEAALVWSQLIEERKAAADARNRRYKDRAKSAISTHPPSADRMKKLGNLAEGIVAAPSFEATLGSGIDSWLVGIGPVRHSLLNEQIKMNNPGASIFLLNNLADNGWDSELLYFLGKTYSLRGNMGDDSLALEAYEKATTTNPVLPEALKEYGYAAIKVGMQESGIAALREYLELRPDAPDAAMIRFSTNQ